jgi:acetyl/propionyl-CoA carboxylase alpha subunit
MSKVIVGGGSRAEALFQAFQFLKGYSVTGVPTTIPFHAWLLANMRFQTEGIDIGYVERSFARDDAERALAMLHPDANFKGAGFVEEVSLTTSNGAPVTAQVVHEEGGTFLVKPLGADGLPRDPSLWRRGSSRRDATEAVESLLT